MHQKFRGVLKEYCLIMKGSTNAISSLTHLNAASNDHSGILIFMKNIRRVSPELY